MKEINENLKILFSAYNDKNLTFYNPNKNRKKKEYKILFEYRKFLENKSSSLLLGNLYSNHLCFSGRLCRMEHYNPKKVIKNEILKINSLDKSNSIFKLLKAKRNKSINIKKKSEIYKISEKIFLSQKLNYEKMNNTLLNVLDKNNCNYQKLPKIKIKNRIIIEEKDKKYKNAETNTVSPIIKRKNNMIYH